MSYTFSTSSGFTTVENIDLITSDIEGQISTTLTSITAIGDSLSIVFDSVLDDEDLAILSNIIRTRDNYQYPVVSPAYIDPDTNLIKHDINGTAYTYYGNQPATIIISKGTQGQYTSIKAAILANNTINNIFVVYPGTYIEDNPIVLPVGTSLKAAGTAANTTIVAANPGSNLLVTSVGTKIFGFTLYGATTVGSVGIYFDGSTTGGQGKFSVANECFIYDCDIGVESDGKDVSGLSDTLYCDKVIVGTQTQSLSKGVYCHNGGQVIGTTCYIFGKPGFYSHTYGFYCDTNAKLSLSPASVWFANIGIYLNSGGSAELSLVTLNYNNIGVYCNTTSPDVRISANSLAISESITYDLSLLPTSANIQIYSSILDDAKINNPNNINMNIKYNAYKFGKYYQAILGDLQLGSVNNPSKLSVGEGLFVNNGVVVYSNSNLEVGTWVNNTIAASSFNYPEFDLFQSVSTDNCLYIGSDTFLYGLKIDIATATSSPVSLADLIWEYWNGSSWISFNTMQTFTDNPCYTYVNSFVSSASKFHVRFGLTTATPFVAKTLNGSSKKWVRLRVVNTLPSIPNAEYFKLHTNTCIINTDGFTEYFGNGRMIKKLCMDQPTFASNSTPTDQELFVADNLSISKTKNTFNKGLVTRVGFCTNLPIDIDTSFPIKLNLAFVTDSTVSGDIEWTLRYCITQSEDNVYLDTLSAPSDPPNANVVTKFTTIGTSKNNMDLREIIEMDVHTFSSFPSDGNTTILWVSLERDGTIPNTTDTYLGNASLSLITSTYISWNNGGHILGF